MDLVASVSLERYPRTKRALSAFHQVWRRLADSLYPWRIHGTVIDIDDIPSDIPTRRAVLVSVSKMHKWLVFDCPCLSGHRVLLNLDPVRRPVWTLTMSRTRRITVHPSIEYRQDDRSCHYFLSRGRIIWVMDRQAVEEGRI